MIGFIVGCMTGGVIGVAFMCFARVAGEADSYFDEQ
ncbi:MAG: DUF3789 domain-containing protein [Oscillospiraceae bacterium]|nr:DUF3789 domain-containing protein [Oscillospiraceae bacterium]